MTSYGPSPIEMLKIILYVIVAIAFFTFLGWLIARNKKDTMDDPNNCPHCGAKLPFPRNVNEPVICSGKKA